MVTAILSIGLRGGCKPGIYTDYINNLDAVPFPRRDLLNVKDYAIAEGNGKNLLFKSGGIRLPMFSSKGCPFRCIFCDVQEKKFRPKSADKVIEEMKSILAIDGVDSVHILDDCFNVNRQRVLEICLKIIGCGLKFQWSARGRVKLDREMTEALVTAGCKRLHIGVESLDDEVLKFMNKRLNLKTIQEFFRQCKDFGIETLGYFIIGAPMETRKYRESLPKMIRKLGVTYPYFNILYPSSHTQYYFSLLKEGIFKRDYWQEFAENPIPDFELPFPRSKSLHKELQDTVQSYINEFYRETSNSYR